MNKHRHPLHRRYVISPNVRRPNTFLEIIMDAFGVPSVRSYDANLKLFETFLVDQYQAGTVPVLGTRRR